MAKLSNSNIGSRKNLIINGAMQISQRGISWAGLTQGDNNQYTADRWKLIEGGAGITAVMTITRDTSEAEGDFSNSIKVDTTTAETLATAGAYVGIRQELEGYTISRLNYGDSLAKDMTLSFYFKSDTKTGNLGAYAYAADGTRLFPFLINVLDNNWNRYSVTIPGDVDGTAITNDATSRMNLTFVLAAGSSVDGSTPNVWQAWDGNLTPPGADNFLDHTDNNLWLTGIQLEIGSQATGFDHKPRTEELLLCQRYYSKCNPTGSYPGATDDKGLHYFLSNGHANADHSIRIMVIFPTSMRTLPTVTSYDLVGTAGKVTMNDGDGKAVITGYHSENSVYVGGSNGAVSVQRMLRFYWEADAEL